jgi:hypothetical protein
MHLPTLCILFAALARAQDFPITTPTSNFSSSLTSLSPSLSTADLSSSISATETSSGSLPLQTEIDVENNSHGELAPIELTPQESVNAVGFEIEMYAQLLQSPMTVPDTDSDPVPVVIPSCPNADAIKETKRWLDSSFNHLNARGIFGSRPKRPVFRKCTPNNLVIDIKFHYVANGFFLTFPPTIASRIQKQVDFMNLILDPQGITLNYLADPQTVYGPEFTEYGFYGQDLTRARKARTQENDQFMRDTRIGGPDVFNVWIVNSITDLEDPAANVVGVRQISFHVRIKCYKGRGNADVIL